MDTYTQIVQKYDITCFRGNVYRAVTKRFGEFQF